MNKSFEDFILDIVTWAYSWAHNFWEIVYGKDEEPGP